MKIYRRTTWEMRNANWCPTCGKKTKMNTIRGVMPTCECDECKSTFMCNFYESATDILNVDDDLIIMPPYNNEKIIDFKKIQSNRRIKAIKKELGIGITYKLKNY